jgi:hypothetical protein
MTISDDLRRDIESTLELVPRWRLEPGAWDAVALDLARLTDAEAAADGKAAYAALTALEDHGPTRLAAIRGREDPGAATRRPPPDRVTELLNSMIHPDRGWTTSAARNPGAEG